MRKTLKSRLIAGILALIAVCVATVPAEDVIVKQGSIGVRYVCPTPTDETQKVLAFISDDASDVGLPYGHGLLTVTNDSNYGTDNHYGTMCQFFPDATSSDEGLGIGKLGGGFFNYPVGTESADFRIYYSLYSGMSAMPEYSTNRKPVCMVGTATHVTNPTNVVGGSTYSTTGLYVYAQPVENGCTMSESLSFQNYGIDVTARLDGDYQATSGSGENFGIYVETKNDLDGAANQEVNSYALYLKAFTWSPTLGGGQTYGIYQEGAYTMNYFEGDISADDVTDRTPGYSGTPQEALNEVLNVRSVDGQIDHSSLPAMARATLNRIEKTNIRIVERTDPTGKVIQDEQYDVRTVEEEGRSLGAMITVLTEAVKGLNEKFETLQAENETLKARLQVLEERQ
ncbi:MAG: hypothetical protein ISS79_10225 [Phycisphaerae bacterium]|nr:hypothetical protein [Phycisphaerae bacterium]